MTSKKMDQNRGTFITVLVVLSVIFLVFSFVSLPASRAVMMALGIQLPIWWTTYIFLLNLVALASYIGIWMLKRWGVYLLVVISVLQILNLLMITRNNLSVIFWSLIFDGLWFWAIYLRWKYFAK